MKFMKKQYFIIILLTTLLSVVGMDVFAHDIAVANADGVTIYYVWTNNQTELEVSYDGSSAIYSSHAYLGNVVIPETVTYEGNNYKVTSIGTSAFSECSRLTSVTIPDGVKSIGSSAFFRCTGLLSVTVPNSVKSIGDFAFKDCLSLQSFIIPNLVTSIEESTFEECRKLTSITIPEGVTSIGEKAFKNCYSLISVAIPNGVTAIKNSTFQNCNSLTSVGFPNSLKTIGQSAFQSCSSLRSVTIPSSVTSVGLWAFQDCLGLTSVHISDLSAWCNTSFVSNPLSYAHHLYLNGELVREVVFPEGTISIKQGVFSGCTDLTSVTIPNSVTTIEESAFSGCSSLKSIIIPNNVTDIKGWAFQNCLSLTSVTIPNSVSFLAAYAFNGCRLENVYAKSVPLEFAQSVFSDRTYQHAMLYVPEGTWGSVVYDSGWYLFNNIRELIFRPDALSSTLAYSLVDINSFGYVVCDDSGEYVEEMKAFYCVDDADARNFWQIVSNESEKCLYNIGAKKYLTVSVDGRMSLSDTPVALRMRETSEGVTIEGSSRCWGFVKNSRVPVDVVSVGSVVKDSESISECFTLNGMRITQPQRGLNIIRMNDGTIRKIVK